MNLPLASETTSPAASHWTRNLYLISLSVFVATGSFSVITPFLPMFLEQLGVQNHTSMWSGLIFSISSLAAAVMAPIWGTISDRTGRKLMMARSGMGMGIAFFLMGFVTNHFQLFALRGLVGLMSGYVPAAITLVAASAPGST